MSIVEQILQLTQKLTPLERTALLEQLSSSNSDAGLANPAHLRGSWKSLLPVSIDLDSELSKIRSEWLSELELEP